MDNKKNKNKNSNITDINNIKKHTNSVLEKTMEQVMHESMMPYAEYVILDRAIPRVEDGLKPVQRRILYTMLELALTPDKPHRKSARIVGDCLGKYHPHGDTSVYDAMVRMAQDFNMSAQMVDGHGNFGSVDGDPAAAMRYTEARMTPIALQMLREIEKDTVSFSLNFDDTQKEPDVLPARYPNLLVNGATGIAVGLATNIPPHCMSETIDAAILVLENPDVSLEKIMTVMPGPDFPTGGYIIDSGELTQAYQTGRGRVLMRAKTSIEPLKNGKNLIVIHELPYQVNKANALEKILRISEEKKNIFSAINDIRDESDRNGMRAVIEIKKDGDTEKILNLLYKYSDLQISFSLNMVAIAQGKPQQMGVKKILEHYIAHQKDVVSRRTKFDLEAAQRRVHILQGLIIAIDNIDKVIKLIRSSKNGVEAKEKLIEAFVLSDVQAQAILEMRLQRLTSLQIVELRKECEMLEKLIQELEEILATPLKLVAVIKKEMLAIKKMHGIPRRTVFLKDVPQIVVDESELKVVEDVVIIYTDTGFKRTTPKLYEARTNSQDDSKNYFVVQTQSNKKLQVFTNYGYMYSLDPTEIPIVKQKERGTLAQGILQGWQDGEKIVALQSFSNYDKERTLLFLTKNGMGKKTSLDQYSTRVKRIVTCNLKANDELICVQEKQKDDDRIVFVTQKGNSICFDEAEISATGRSTAGVKCVALDKQDVAVFAVVAKPQGEIVIITDRGYAKRSLIWDFEKQARNGKGLKTIDFKKNKSNGEIIAGALYIDEPQELLITQTHGEETKLSSEEIFVEKRFSTGKPLVLALMDNVVEKFEIVLNKPIIAK